MAPSCCFQLQTTRGPHSGTAHRYCHGPTETASLSPAHGLSIGRKKRCWLCLPQDLEVSSVHAEFRVIKSGTSVAVRDVNSTNGTKLNGKQLEAQKDYLLSNGDLIAVGRTSLRFVQMDHGQSCDIQTGKNATASGALVTLSVSSTNALSAAVPAAIVLDEDSIKNNQKKEKNGAGSKTTLNDQPDTEPAHDEVVLHPLIKDVNAGVSEKREKVDNERDSGPKAVFDGDEAVGEASLEEATCTKCRAIIGQLGLPEQQAHLNKCLGGRVIISVASSVKDAAPKRRQRGKAEGLNVAKRQRKPKASKDGAKARMPRKRKRAADAEANIELALALTGKTNMSKEEQTDELLAVAKMKLAQLDDEMAKLAKRRMILVKSLDRLEKTKEKLRKSQVLPPAKVVQLFDLKAALEVIYPSKRQARPVDRQVSEGLSEVGFRVKKRYASMRCRKQREGDKKEQDEVAAVDAISMWARASQQRFALPNEMRLYCNTVLRPFLGDYKSADSGDTNIDHVTDGKQNGGEDDKRHDMSDAKNGSPNLVTSSEYADVPLLSA